jgi:cyclophilin family peptidyl-prolyl cis-trans isomerase
MAQHKAPTAVTIAPTEEKTGFALWIDSYWKHISVLALLIAGGILLYEHSHETRQVESDLSWEKLMSVASEDHNTLKLTGNTADLIGVEQQIKGQVAAPWALYVAATSALGRRQFDEAKQALDRLRQDYPAHSLVTEKYVFDPSSTPQSMVEHLEQRIAAESDWVKGHPELFQNPELPADAPRVRLNTDRGTIVLGLYANLAPKHVENFLKLVREGYYKGTKFHRVLKGMMIQGGDPNSVQGDASTWGQGGPGYKLDREENTLKHFAGVLSAAKQAGDKQSSGSQFFITTGEAHQWDSQYVVFGRVLEGMDVVNKIESGNLVGGTDRPEDPATIQSAEVL